MTFPSKKRFIDPLVKMSLLNRNLPESDLQSRKLTEKLYFNLVAIKNRQESSPNRELPYFFQMEQNFSKLPYKREKNFPTQRY